MGGERERPDSDRGVAVLSDCYNQTLTVVWLC